MNPIPADEVFALMDGHAGGDYLFGVDFERKQGFFIPRPQEQSDVLWRVGPYSNFTPTAERPTGGRFTAHPMGFDAFRAQFDRVYRALRHGDTFLTNLTIRTPIETDYSLTDIALHSNAPYVLLLPERLVCFSPEPFVRIDGQGRISSHPMKGTISAAVPNALQTLLDDPKEQAEHHTIVDLIRNDLSTVAHGVTVERFRYADVLHTSRGDVIQTSSLVAGQMEPYYAQQLGSAVARLLPAGSVSGAPKCATLRLIGQTEPTARGFYCGVFGRYDGANLDTAVMIRYIEQDESGTKYFRSGGGITAQSNARSEYEEMIQKIYLPFVAR